MTDVLKKRSYFDDSIASELRVGNDFVLLDAKSFWPKDNTPYIADATTAIILIRGEADILVNMTRYQVKAPAMVILMEGMVVQHNALSENAKLNVMGLSNEFTDRILSDANVSIQLRAIVRTDPVFPIAGKRGILMRFHFLLQDILSMTDNKYRLEAVKYMTLTLFCGFALGRDEYPSKEHSHKEEIVENYMKLVRNHYQEERGVAFYADKMCLSAKYLSQVVKDITGKPALDWIDEHVITESKALLKSTNLSVEQISIRMNFLSTALFGKFFKRVCGLSPREYRNAVK